MRRSKRASARAASSARRSTPHSASPAARESPLRWLRRRKDKSGRPLLTEAQFQAGEKLAADYCHAQLMPRVTANWSGLAPSERRRRSAPGAGVEMRDAVAAARQRVNRALEAVGAEMAGILVDVCCHETGLEAAERSAGWPCRSGKVVLDIALTILARHYGLIPPERALAARLRHWGDAGYRPTLDAWRPAARHDSHRGAHRETRRDPPQDTHAETLQPGALPKPAKSA
jgi:uncharacterized protein DUF6456